MMKLKSLEFRSNRMGKGVADGLEEDRGEQWKMTKIEMIPMHVS